MEIIIALKDLSAAGFKSVETNIGRVEKSANGANLSGFSRSAKTVEKDAESAAGKDVKGGGGIGGLAAGMLSLGGGPATVAVAALAAVTAAGIALTDSYDKIEVQEKAIEIAAQDHGIALDAMRGYVDSATAANAQYGFSATDTRGAIQKLTEAGMSLSDQQSAMGPIMDLARAKNLSLADAANAYELALMGNAKGLKDLGIALPKVTSAQAEHDAAQKLVTKDAGALTTAQQQLASVEASLAGKTHLTAAEHARLSAAQQKVQHDADLLKAAQDALNKTQTDAELKAARLKQMNDALTGSVGGQRNAVSPLDAAQAKLGLVWDRLATTVGPVLEDLFARLVNGLGIFLNGTMDVAGAIGDKLGPVMSWLGDHVLPPILLGFKTLGDVVRTVLNLVGQAVSAVANSPIGGLISGGAGAIGNILGKLPHFASGGVVSGPTVAMIGEGGEREAVVPESKWGQFGGRGGAQVIHTHLYLDGRELAYSLERPMGALLNLRGTSATSYGGS